MYRDYSEVQARVQEHYDMVRKLYPNVLGTFCFGSWNYGLGREDSDVDTKSVVVPSFRDFALGVKPVNKTLVLSNGEHAEVLDVRLWVKQLRKQNKCNVELLFTKLRAVNPKYQKFINSLNFIAEKIARYDMAATLSCAAGMASTEFSLLERFTQEQDEKDRELGYHPKRLMRLKMLTSFATKLSRGDSYEEALDCKDERETLLALKDGFLPLESARELAEECRDYMRRLAEMEWPLRDKSVDDYLDNFLMTLFEYEFGVSK